MRLPYAGADPWPALTLAAARRAALRARRRCWPSGRGRSGGARLPVPRARLLLVLVASPVVSLGGTRPLRARPRAGRADASASCGSSGCRCGRGSASPRCWRSRSPARCRWPRAADRERAVVRLPGVRRGPRPRRPGALRLGPRRYGADHLAARRRRGAARRQPPSRRTGRSRNLDEFDGDGVDDDRRRRLGATATGARPARRLARASRSWTSTLARHHPAACAPTDVIGAGTTLACPRHAARRRAGGDAGHLARRRATFARAATPTRVAGATCRGRPRGQLAQASSGDRGIDRASRTISTGHAAARRAGRERRRGATGRPRSALAAAAGATVRFPPFEPRRRGEPSAGVSRRSARTDSGDVALRSSPYAAHVAARAAAEGAAPRTPYDYVARGRPLPARRGFSYDRAPPARRRRAGRRSTRSCSTPRAATASTSPARWRCCCGWAASPRGSATGFSPGRLLRSASTRGSCATPTRTPGSRRGSTSFGWVTFDPTPAGTPARSQIAALERRRAADGRRRRRRERRRRRGTAPAARRRARRTCSRERSAQPGGARRGRRRRRRRRAWSWAARCGRCSVALLLAALVRGARRRRRARPADAARPRDRRARDRAAPRRAPGAGGHDAAPARAAARPARREAAAYLRALRAAPLRARAPRRRPRAQRRALRRDAGAGPRPRAAGAGAAHVLGAAAARAESRASCASAARRDARRRSVRISARMRSSRGSASRVDVRHRGGDGRVDARRSGACISCATAR